MCTTLQRTELLKNNKTHIFKQKWFIENADDDPEI